MGVLVGVKGVEWPQCRLLMVLLVVALLLLAPGMALEGAGGPLRMHKKYKTLLRPVLMAAPESSSSTITILLCRRQRYGN